ncbi:MAG: phosphatase domain-containing protein [Elusimicrobiota bacterium]
MNSVNKILGCLSLAALIPLLGTTSFAAKNLLISDIDDTIKLTGIHSSGVVGHAMGTTNEFAGMSILYNGLAKDLGASGKVEYLTAAPGVIDNLGIDFLREAGFPPGRGSVANFVVSGRDAQTESSGEFKARKLIELYEREKPELMILVGDNGEQDIDAYSALKKYIADNNGAARIYSFIHHVYESAGKGREIPAGHIPFLTAADLAVQFAGRGWLKVEALTRVLGEIEYDSGSGQFAKQVVPAFMECSSFNAWPALGPKILGQAANASALTGSYEQVKANVNGLCGN